MPAPPFFVRKMDFPRGWFVMDGRGVTVKRFDRKSQAEAFKRKLDRKVNPIPSKWTKVRVRRLKSGRVQVAIPMGRKR